jgi:indolepyruvate ferredoxin oxidoreductase
VSQTLDELIGIRVRDLVAYQDEAYAARYRAFVRKVRDAEQKVAPQSKALTTAVARNLYKVMAIKDEYEIARLYTEGDFAKRLKEEFGGSFRIAIHLAPPLLSRRNSDTGLPEKSTFGPWMLSAMKILARAKHLRGGRLDIFGRTAERKAERALLSDYEQRIETLLPLLTRDNLALAADYANVPDMVRGYGHIKDANMKRAAARFAELEAKLTVSQPQPTLGAVAMALTP